MNTTKEVAEIVEEIINNFILKVDQHLIEILNAEHKKGRYSNRENIDALALEQGLKRKGILSVLEKVLGEAYQWRHDWAYDSNHLIDLKRINKPHSNIIVKPWQITESHHKKQLTHIVGYSQNKETNYKIGDILTFKFEGLSTTQHVLDECFGMNPEYRFYNKSSFEYKPKSYRKQELSTLESFIN